MGFIQWSDVIAPTNPFAAIFFGIIISVVVAIFVWFETKEKRTVFITFLVGVIVSCILVLLLNIIGFYR